jgi:hypothetical protein
MKTQLSEVRKALRAVTRANRGAHHQIASRRLAAAVKFQQSNPEHAAQCLLEARFHAQAAGAM